MNLPSYPEICTIAQLYPGPQILLGQDISWTEKRDGSNLRLSVSDDSLAIGTRHQDIASERFRGYFALTGMAERCEALIRDSLGEWGQDLVLFGELLLAGKSPARFETHDKHEFVLFDIWQVDAGFQPYTLVYQNAYHYNIPIVELYGRSSHTTLESLYEFRDQMLALAKERGREGVVLKSSAAYAKEKLDLPVPIRVQRDTGGVKLPPLAESELMGAVAKAHADLGAEFTNKAAAMPLIATYVAEEQVKHLCSKPVTKLFVAYNNYLEGLVV